MEIAAQKPAPIATLCPCTCGVTLFPGSELGYTSLDCLWWLRGDTPREGLVPTCSPPL
jgi:hypothetical protein